MKTFKEIQQESRGHKILASKLASMDRIKRGVGPEDKSNDVPFEPDAPKKNPSATAGKYGQGYSTARHLARQGLKSVSEEEQIDEAPVKPRTKEQMTSPEMLDKKYSMYSHDTLKDLHAKGDWRARRELEKRNKSEEVKMKEETEEQKKAKDELDLKLKQWRNQQRAAKSMSEAAQDTLPQHKVIVTVSDPNHPSVSKRKDTIMKRVVVRALGRDEAKAKAEAHYKKQGYKVHDSEYHSKMPSATLKTEEAEQIDEISKATLGSYVAKATADKASAGKKEFAASEKAREAQNIGDRAGVKAASAEQQKHADRADKRRAGISLAKAKMAEELELNESEMTQAQIMKKIKDGTHEALTDIKPGKHVELRHTGTGKRKMVYVKPSPFKEETEGDSMSMMEQYLAAIEGKVDFRDALAEKTLTPAEMKKREEVAKAIERENPGMDKSKKMAIATATAKKVAEGKTHTVPKTEKEKKLAALADPKDKITHADVMVGRGVKKEEVELNLEDYSIEELQDFMMSEEFEQLDEISKSTLGSYINKATKEVSDRSAFSTANNPFVVGAKAGNIHVSNAHDYIRHKRVKGIAKAVGKLTKEDIEQIDEADQPVSVTVHYKHKDGKTNSATHFTAKNAAEHEADVKKAGGTITGRTLNYASGKKEHRSMNEDIEQIDELSKNTLDSYLGKSIKDRDRHEDNIIDTPMGASKEQRASAQNSVQKLKQRKIGIALASKKLAKEEFVSEGMISYMDFRDKIEAHKKAGHKVVDDKYSKDKAHFTSIDKEGIGRKLTHTASGTKVENLGKVAKVNDDEDDSNETETRGRGRPAGSKSGARRH